MQYTVIEQQRRPDNRLKAVALILFAGPIELRASALLLRD